MCQGQQRTISSAVVPDALLAGRFALSSILMLVLVRVLTRRTSIAFVASTLLMRFGLLAAVAAMCLHSPLAHGPLTWTWGEWYGLFTIVTLVMTVVVALYGFITSFGGRSVIGAGVWDDA